MRQRIFEIVELAKPGDKVSKAYDYFITILSVVSLIPLMFKESNYILQKMDTVVIYLLFMDYIFHWIVYDIRTKQYGKTSAFVRYPFSLWALCDIFAILPALGLLGKQFRLLRMLRVTKLLRYSKSFRYIGNVFKKERKTLGSVLLIALAYIYVSALMMFCYEPDTFEHFFEALYWATTALTTVGYGDVYPVSEVGRLISMMSSLFGIAIIALPAGIVTAGFMDELNHDDEAKKESRDDEQ